MGSQQYPIRDRVSKVCGDAQSNQICLVSKNSLGRVPKIDHKLGRASRINMRIKDPLHLFAQRFSQAPGIRVACCLYGKDVQQCHQCPIFRRQRSEVGNTVRDSSERSVGNRTCLISALSIDRFEILGPTVSTGHGKLRKSSSATDPIRRCRN